MEKSGKMTRITAVLMVALLVMALAVIAAVGLMQPARTASATSAVNFVKVTAESQITEANIGECTFAEAKQWIYNNWDEVFADAEDSQSFDFFYYAENDYYYIPVRLEEYATKDVFDANCTGAYDDFFENIALYLSDYGEIVYLCDPSSVSGGGSGSGSSGVAFTKVESEEQIASENIEECTFEEAKAWIVAHWGDIKQTDAFVSLAVYSNGTELQYITIMLLSWDTAEQFENGEPSADTMSIDDCKESYEFGYDIYLCTNGGSGGGQQGGSAKPIALGTTYYYGDEIEFSGGEWVYYYVPNDWKNAIQAGTYEVREPDTYSSGYFFFNE